MNKIIGYFTVLVIFISSCQDNVKEKVVSRYEDGKPSKVLYYTDIKGKEECMKEARFHKNGVKSMEGKIKQDKRDSLWTSYYPTGKKWSECYFKNGKSHGKSFVWYDNGKILQKGFYKNGLLDGKWTYYNRDGYKIKEITYKEGKVLDEVKFY